MNSLVENLRDAFKRKRYGSGEYDPDFDLFDAAADKIELLLEVLEEAEAGIPEYINGSNDELFERIAAART